MGISLIVIGFIIPIVIILIVRKIRANRRKLKRGEKFEKDGHERLEIDKEGITISIKFPFSNSLI